MKICSKVLTIVILIGSLSLAASPEIAKNVYGCLLGAALGDALGAPVEFIKTKEAICKAYPPQGIQGISNLKKTDFKASPDGKQYIPYTDDTAMTILVTKSLIKSRTKNGDIQSCMNDMALSFIKDMNQPEGWAKPERAPGICCLKSTQKIEAKLLAFKDSQDLETQWWIGGDSKGGGCGSVMRAHPFGLFFYNNPEKAAEWAAIHSTITHGAPIATAACAAMATGIAYACQGLEPIAIAQKMVVAAQQYDSGTAKMIEKAISYAKDTTKSCDEVFVEFQGWAAHEAVAAAIYIFLKHPTELKKAILLGVNTPGDSDSIASMGGALVGAYVGMDSECESWVNLLEQSEALKSMANDTVRVIK